MRRVWTAFGAVVVLSFAVLGFVGVRIYQLAPPIPDRVVTTDGRIVIDRGQIEAGQNVWQSMGGMESGSIWGHGSYVAPDWTADWLHREATFILDAWAGGAGRYAAQPGEARAALESRLQGLMRTNGFDATTSTLTIAPVRADAFAATAARQTGCPTASARCPSRRSHSSDRS